MTARSPRDEGASALYIPTASAISRGPNSDAEQLLGDPESALLLLRKQHRYAKSLAVLSDPHELKFALYAFRCFTTSEHAHVLDAMARSPSSVARSHNPTISPARPARCAHTCRS